MTEKRDEILILRVSPSDKERIRMKMEELGISNMSAEDVRDLKERFDEFWRIGKELLTRLSTIW